MTQEACRPQAVDQTDRYVSFCGIDCDLNARRLMETLDRHLSAPGRSNAFWDYFQKKRRGEGAPQADDLFLIHCNINQIREFLEDCEDEDGLTLLTRIELECC